MRALLTPATMTVAALMIGLAGAVQANDHCAADKYQDQFAFEDPVQITPGGKPVEAEDGYAAPCLADVDGDGTLDLLVGQIRDGKIAVFKGQNVRELSFAGRQWLQADGQTATVPGVW